MLATNVDATHLESGLYTQVGGRNVVIFKNPHTRLRNDDAGTAYSIRRFVASARNGLAPGGQIHINASKAVLLKSPLSRSALGVNSTDFSIYRNFGESGYYAPYVPRHTDTENPIPNFEDKPERVQYFKSFAFQ